MTNKKFLLIGKRLDRFNRGSHVISKRFCNQHPKHLEYMDGTLVTSLEKLAQKYKKLVLRCQVPMNYKFPTNAVDLYPLNHLIFIRPHLNNSLYNSATNGFYSFKDNTMYNHYVPLITDYPNQITHIPKRPCLGFYVRRGSHELSIKVFRTMIKNLRTHVDVITMGNRGYNFHDSYFIKKYDHTLSHEHFFNTVTHYVYPDDKFFFDPFPHSLLEAVQTGKQIIIPDTHKQFRDGVTDMKDFIKWHEAFDPDTYYDNSDCPLTAGNFRKFYKKLFENDFEYSFDRSKYKTMIDWVENEVF